MSTIVSQVPSFSHTNIPLTGIYNNLAFSQDEVWSWYVLPVPESDYGVYPEDAGLPKYLKSSLTTFVKEFKKLELNIHFLVSTPIVGESPIVCVGVQLGTRSEQKNLLIPQPMNKFINLLADAPLDDYISEKELNHWTSVAEPFDYFFGSNLGFKLASTDQLAYLVKKKFYPAIPFSYGNNIDLENKGDWGEFYITEIAKANITVYPKHLEITQELTDDNKKNYTGYRTSLEIIKCGDNVEYPEFETWLPYVKSFPFITDFSIRFIVTSEGYKDLTTTVSVEASSPEILIEYTEDLITHYEASNMYVVWNSGDQLSLFNESFPTGKNIDRIKRPKSSELNITHIYDSITFSKQDVYAWVEIPLTQFEFLDDTSKKQLSYALDLALASLAVSEEKNVECHIIIQGSPFDAREWIQALDAKNAEANPLPYNRQFLTEMYQHVENSDFRNRIVLLGVNLGKRNSYAPSKTTSPTFLNNILNLVPQVVADEVSSKEILYWKTLATPIFSTLINSQINAFPARTEDIAFAIKKNFYPNMPLPSPETLMLGGNDNVWDKNDIPYLTEGIVENHSKYLKVTQVIEGETYEGYRATLAFSKFPETMYYPYTEPWIHYASLLPFTTDFSLRFTIEPARKVRKEVGRKLKEVMDQSINMESAGGSTNIEVSEHLRSGEELEYTLKKDPSPWIYGRYRITVEARSLDELKERVKMVIDHYRSLEIEVIWPTGDQLSLLKESLPNDIVRVTSYEQRTTLPIISTGVPAGTGTAGDMIIYQGGKTLGWMGPYLGYTTGHTQEPCFLSMHSTIDTNHSNGLAITGSPGSGKTFATLTTAYQNALAGVWTIYIDPKADAQRMGSLPGLEGHVKTLDLKNGNPGILDPFLIGPTLAEQKELAFEIIYLFLGGMDKITEEQQVQLALAVDSITSKRQHPSLRMIVEFLMNSPNITAQSLGAKLNVLMDLPFAQLCFSQGVEQMKLRPEDGLTILTLLGLDLPPVGLDRNSYTNSNRLAVGIMFLLSAFTQQLMLNADKSHPKSIIIDEAWSITSTTQGIDLIKRVARMGRAHNLTLTLVSQNAEDFDKEGVANSISTRLAFRAETPDEISSVLSFLNLEPSDINKDTIRSLDTGECLMKDWSGRVARVQIDGWDPKMRQAFETNPRSRAKTELE